VRRGLDQELGSVPGERLKRLHGLILDQVPVSELFPTQVGTAPRVSAPDNLPLHGELVGRERELAAISAAAESGAVLSLQTISGMGGVGKSLLALHAAERLSTRYPDGRVFVNLLGHTPGQRPLSPQAALALLLRLLGVPARRIPVELDDLIAEWRTLMANRRVVLVLDDAADPDQLRPLIPGQSPSLVIVTSRGRLHGLPGIRRVMLDVLSPADAAIMFRRLVENPDRASRSAEVAEIVRICGNLPLAIELAASRFNSRLTWDLAHLIHRLSHGDNRLLEFHDQTRELAQVFGMSYQALTHEQRKAFRLLSLALGQDFGTQAAAALLDLPAARTERLLEGLLDLHLLREPVAERYTAHDLLREFARTLTEAEDSEADRRLAVGRLVDFYIRAADRADRLLFPERARFPVTGDTTEDGLPHWDGPSDAEAWFTAESTALLDAERWARTHGHARQAALLAHALGGFLDAEGLWRDAQRVHGHAVRHWQQAGDRRAETRARIDLAAAETHVGRYDRAISTTEAALALARADSDTEGEAEALQHLALMLWSQGRLDSALSTQRRCLALRERGGSDRQVARAVNNLAIFLLYLGRYSEAKEFFDAALSESRRLGDHRAEALVLNNMGDLYNHMGEKELARRSLEHSLAISRTSARKADLAAVQVTLANSMEIPAELDSALDLYRQALICFRELGDRRREVDTMNGIGLAFRTAGRLAEAAAHHATAADLAHSIGAALEESHSLHELGITEYRMNAPASAAAHLRAALALAREIGAPEEEARAAAGLSEILGSRE
jgi:tetratricopeptide (TPR) repeat protein